MQYVLTKEELDGLAPVAEVKARDEALAEARRLILTNSGFVCIHDRPGDRHGRRYGDYCDVCPINLARGRHESRLICTLNREYSK